MIRAARSLWSRLRAPLRALGWGNGLLSLLAEALSRLSKGRVRIIKYDLVVQPLPAALALPARLGGKIQVAEVGPGDPQLALLARPPEVLAYRFAQQATCLLATRDGRLAGMLWYVKERYQEDEVRCVFLPSPATQAIWDFDVYVAPEYRLTGAFARLWDNACQRLRAEGYRFSCSRISAFNPASQAAHARLGARRVGTGTFVCIGSWQLAVWTPGPRWHLSRAAGNLPSIVVQAASVEFEQGEST